ncbi:MAG: class I tRNA ligase family protein, partial [SAR324 cluster bacterium]|nr:class I tRNA ligase family protein [SAR324 cluster bacterium]
DGTHGAMDESELPLLLPKVNDYQPTGTGESPLAKAEEWLNVQDPKTGMKGTRETNTMPNWAGSCWYYLRFIDPHNEKAGWDPELEKAWMPVDFYVGGAEHAVLHLLYARFWHKVLFDLGFVSTREPFQRLYNQGMLLSYAYKDKRGALVPVDEVENDANGNPFHKKTGQSVERIVAKMSKSLRNVVNPDEVIKEYGVDTLRLYLMFMGPVDSSRIWDSKAIMGIYRFLKRMWNCFNAHANRGYAEKDSEFGRRELHKLIKRISEDTENISFNTAIAGFMEFLGATSMETFTKESLGVVAKLLSPYAPHLAEEVWVMLGNTPCVALQDWPSYNPEYIKENSVTVVIQIDGKKRGTMNVPVSISEDAMRNEAIKALSNTPYALRGDERLITVYQQGTTVPRLINVVRK